MNKCEIQEPMEVPFDGIFHPEGNIVFNSLKGYMEWYLRGKRTENAGWIGLLTHRHNWTSGNTQVENALIKYPGLLPLMKCSG